MNEVEAVPLCSESQMVAAVCKTHYGQKYFLQTDQNCFSARLTKELIHPCCPDSISPSLSLHNLSFPDQICVTQDSTSFIKLSNKAQFNYSIVDDV